MLAVAGAIVVLGIALFIAGDGKAPKRKAVASVNDGMADSGATFSTKPSPFFDGWKLLDVAPSFRGIKLTDNKLVGFPGAIQRCDRDDDVELGALPRGYDAREAHASCFEDAIYSSQNCSSSYALAAAASLGQRYCIASGTPTSLSPQQVLSCDKKSRGCDGGSVDAVWNYIESRGLYPESCLPYVAKGRKEAECKTTCEESQKIRALSHCRLSGDKALKHEIRDHGPVVVPMLLVEDLLVYSEGVYALGEEPAFVRDAAGAPVYVAVTIVGWGKEGDIKYWIVANSWGRKWGEDGYARISIDNGVISAHQAVVATAGTPAAIAAKETADAARAAQEATAKVERAAMQERVAARKAERRALGIEDPAEARARERMEEDDVVFSDEDLDLDLSDEDFDDILEEELGEE